MVIRRPFQCSDMSAAPICRSIGAALVFTGPFSGPVVVRAAPIKIESLEPL
ncbi:hypothetical protein CES85_0400 [Ochrobactrum quorumnocens]|uniref:Uncharacterized protein n=1 Tax=Ochrobactrum quorumnocens TaxID=271865 RepID=A0A248UHH6_9HYPH|nr:hypothetical protein CES85_0400 [[Ochrobactrum] quorumnocens]